MKKLYTPKEAAEILGIDAATLAVWRCTQRVDLPFVKIGGRVRYILEDVLQFIENNRRS